MHPLVFAALVATFALTSSSMLEPGPGLYNSRVYSPPGGPITTTTTTTTAAPPAGSTTVNDECLRLFNAYRAIHRSQPLKYSATLQTVAQRCADYYTTEVTARTLSADADIFDLGGVVRCTLAGTRGHRFGISANVPLGDVASTVAKKWYAEKDGDSTVPIAAYNFAAPDPLTLGFYGGFTAMIWNATTTFACAVSAVPTPGTNTRFLSVVYQPAGNVVVDESLATYIRNVKP